MTVPRLCGDDLGLQRLMLVLLGERRPPRKAAATVRGGRRHWTDGGAYGRKQAAEHTHHQRKDNPHQQKVERDFESERQIRKCLKVHGIGRKAVKRKHDQAAKDPGHERNQQRFEQEGQDDIPTGKAEGAHGGDFAAAFGNGGIHGVKGAEHGANGHDARNQAAEHGDQACHIGGLLGVIIHLALHIHIQPLIGDQGVLELLERGRRREVHGGGLKDVVGTLENLVDRMCASHQTSESKEEPPASKTPTTFHCPPPKFECFRQ